MNLKAIRRRLRADILLFGKYAIPEMFTVASAKFHREVADLLIITTIKKLLFIAPRGHSKSSIIGCIFVLFHIMFHKGPKFIVLVSKTQGHAKRLLGTICNVLNYGRRFQRIFGYWGKLSMVRDREDEVILKDGTCIVALGTGQQLVGLKHIHQRPTLIVLDDPEDKKNTKTINALSFNRSWFFTELLPMLDPIKGRIVVIGCPVCEGCLVLEMEKLQRTDEEPEGWEVRRYDAIIDEDKHEVLWPEYVSWAFLMQAKKNAEEMGELSTWYSQYRCSIVPDEEQLFKPEYNRYYRGWHESSKIGKAYIHITHRANKKADLDKGKLEKEEIIPVNPFMGIDPASSESKRADHSVNFKIDVDKDLNIYILPYYRKRVPPTKHCQAIVEDYEEFYPLKTTPEATGYQEALRDILRKFSQLWTKDKKPIFIPGLEAKVLPREKKTKRHKSALHVHFYRRHVWLLEGMEAFESELITWREDKTKIDDLMDGFYLAIIKAYPAIHEYEGKKSATSAIRKRRGQENYQDA